jgi:hypothetical protein
MVVYFAVSFGLEFFFPVASYTTDGFLSWGKVPVSQILLRLVLYVGYTLAGFRVYGSHFLAISLAVSLIVAALVVVRQRKICMVDLWVPVATICAFLLNFALGSALQTRSMQSLPLLIAICWCYIFCSLPLLKVKKSVVNRLVTMFLCFVCLFCIQHQIKAVNRLTYTAEYRSRLETELVNQVVYRIEENFGIPIRYQTVVFVGHYYFNPFDKVWVRAETISGSFLNWDDPTEQSRKSEFFTYLGYAYRTPTSEQVSMAVQHSASMPLWPDSDSVEKVDDVVIVKFADGTDNIIRGYERVLETIPNTVLEVLKKLKILDMLTI